MTNNTIILLGYNNISPHQVPPRNGVCRRRGVKRGRGRGRGRSKVKQKKKSKKVEAEPEEVKKPLPVPGLSSER